MAPPTYSVIGSVRLPNELPVADVQVHLSTGGTTTTDRQGAFRFDGLAKGTYDVTVTLTGLRVEPEAHTVRLPGDGGAIFFVLPMPVVATLSSDALTPITYVDTQGLATRLTFPATTEELPQVMVTPELPGEVAGFLAAGHSFTVAPAGFAAGAASAPNVPSVPPAFQVELQYSQADLRSILAAEGLTLLWLSPEGWVNATTTCETEGTVAHDYGKRTIQTTLCAWGTYSLVGPAYFLRLPVLQANPETP
jgi:hypothetical protein